VLCLPWHLLSAGRERPAPAGLGSAGNARGSVAAAAPAGAVRRAGYSRAGRLLELHADLPGTRPAPGTPPARSAGTGSCAASIPPWCLDAVRGGVSRTVAQRGGCGSSTLEACNLGELSFNARPSWPAPHGGSGPRSWARSRSRTHLRRDDAPPVLAWLPPGQAAGRGPPRVVRRLSAGRVGATAVSGAGRSVAMAPIVMQVGHRGASDSGDTSDLARWPRTPTRRTDLPRPVAGASRSAVGPPQDRRPAFAPDA
jgi:hypothetical protein